MHAATLASTSHAVASFFAGHDEHGEAVLVAPRQSASLDDRVFASHACFSWRSDVTVLVQPGGGKLRYRTQRPVIAFADRDLSRSLHPGDRITRTWDGATFEVTCAYREGGRHCCDLVELRGPAH